ncbi:unnamed protein product [Echinostoma caproni]|uniref:IRS-type PTB domain-containing protein n=1 Tax=Echinostoma caproni TaxID=27848 RepID=A0A183A6N4_9TREM|nr:unnamed protein product [Echinostoma caproni]
MVGRSRSVGQLNQLLKISVRVEHYVELSTKDTFDTIVFQNRLRQHFTIPWREPKKPIKTRLCVSYTSLILTSASWWPYRQQRCLDFESVQRFLTFHQAGRYCAIGMQDDGLSEKQFIVLLTKSIADLDQLLRVMQTQLSLWKRTPQTGTEPDHPISVVNSRLSALKAQSLASPRSNLIGPRPKTLDKGNNQLPLLAACSLPGTDRRSNVNPPSGSSLYSSTIMLNACQCKPEHLPRIDLTSPEEKLKVAKVNGLSQSPRVLICNTPRSTPGMEIICKEDPKTVVSPTQTYPAKRTNQNGNHRTYCRSQPPDSKFPETDSQSWEVDVKYIRYDPVLGNVLDDHGSVYLYTAHQISR